MDEMVGRDLDRTLGREVFGLHVVPAAAGYRLVDGHERAVVTYERAERRSEAEAWDDCPDYSTDTTAALDLVTRLDDVIGGDFALIKGRDESWAWKALYAGTWRRQPFTLAGYGWTPAAAIVALVLTVRRHLTTAVNTPATPPLEAGWAAG